MISSIPVLGAKFNATATYLAFHRWFKICDIQPIQAVYIHSSPAANLWLNLTFTDLQNAQAKWTPEFFFYI